MVLQLPGLLQVLLHPPDVINRGLEDGALVPAHIPVGQVESEVHAQGRGQVFARSLVGGSKTLFGAHVTSPNFAPNPRSSQPLLMKEADLHLHRTGPPR